ncbi:hypothetical protein FIU94_08730 [Sulfitobacter sp. THAF37]|uniref:SRPBCC family protein n=1 Tax=Sulfitobacter sp. THAF37 TaxID=2587855 RepID=UPI0012696B97|nr:SRPBCC family protein [Sulfitobacter sp. THAF37]QFT58908.1 hypothetical protein FIU94_08730 [Sulfitobacter sp. THAF37]
MTDHDPKLDLELTRTIAASPHTLWRCWTEPELLKRWFCPAPYKVTRAEVDPTPGGIFLTAMQAPDGTDFDAQAGCVLEAEPARRFTFTDALGPGFRPLASGFMTGIITLEAVEGGTRYTARVKHATDADRQKHLDMGFHEGWGTAADQMAALAATLGD